MMRRLLSASVILPLLLAAGCSNNVPDGTRPDSDVLQTPGTAVQLSLNAETLAAKEKLDGALSEVKELSAAEFAEKVKVPFSDFAYDPLSAEGLELINGSALGLDVVEKERLKRDGFVISGQTEFPTFTYGYASIYAEDLPLYVSADSILYAVHRSYDDILKTLELKTLVPLLENYLKSLRAQLNQLDVSKVVQSDLDLYLTIAESLLADSAQDALFSENNMQVNQLFDACKKADGVESILLFDAKRRVDFSQCKPRGHYTDDWTLEAYFRAMIWLGRIDFRMIETQEDGSQLFHRRQTEAALALDELMSAEARNMHGKLDAMITAFVGEHDYMTVPQLAALKSDLGVTTVADLADHTDAEVAGAIAAGGYGTQRISSHYMVNGMGSGTLPLSSSFALLGQRYVIDSHVFSNVVFDRAGGGSIGRLMPDPLDVAYAALQNDQAGTLLSDELKTWEYAADLETMRTIADSEAPSFWEQNLYNRWLGALRTLSPASALEQAEGESLPAVAKTESWGRRLLSTQLASWAELRHDTILYTKQSYTGGNSCEFPDAYVEPYPEFFGKIHDYATHALGIFEELQLEPDAAVIEHFERLSAASDTLRQMAEHQRTGTPHSEEHMAFINQTVSLEPRGCGEQIAVGWYPDLFYGDPLEWNPTIADVHTQPMDAVGNEVGRILHVGTGNARLMVTTVETCSGPRAYAGLVSSYFEVIEEGWKRLDDPTWETRLGEGTPASPEWFQPLIGE